MIINFPTAEWQISVMQNLVRSAWFKISCTSSWNFPQGATASFAPLSLENTPSAGSCQCLNSFSSGKFLIKKTNKLRLLEMGHRITEKWSFIHSVSSICGHFFFFFFNLFIYFWLCCLFVSVWGLSPVVASGGHSSSRCAGLSPPRPLSLRSTGSRHAGSVVVAHGPSRSGACGILPDQGSNPCPLHWQADSQPLRHQGSPVVTFTCKKYRWQFPYLWLWNPKS